MRRLIRGARWSKEYGHHPGTPYLSFMVVAGFYAGLQRGWGWGIAGSGIMLLVFGPIWLMGCWNRGDICKETK